MTTLEDGAPYMLPPLQSSLGFPPEPLSPSTPKLEKEESPEATREHPLSL